MLTSEQIQSEPASHRSPSRVAVAVLAIMLLLVGGGTGWLLRGAANDAEPEYVLPGGGTLTERQLEMVNMVGPYIAAWHATDGDAVASFMTADGYIRYPDDDAVFRVSDGTLRARVTDGPYDTIHAFEPMTVYDDWIVLSGRIDSMSLNWLSVIRFTPAGEVRILSETIFY